MAACTFVPYDQTLNDHDFPVSNASKMARKALEESGLAAKKNNFTFNAEPVPLLQEICDQTYAAHGFDNDRTLQQIILDTRDEIWMLISACSVLNCENIIVDQIDAPKSLNQKDE